MSSSREDTHQHPRVKAVIYTGIPFWKTGLQVLLHKEVTPDSSTGTMLMFHWISNQLKLFKSGQWKRKQAQRRIATAEAENNNSQLKGTFFKSSPNKALPELSPGCGVSPRKTPCLSITALIPPDIQLKHSQTDAHMHVWTGRSSPTHLLWLPNTLRPHLLPLSAVLHQTSYQSLLRCLFNKPFCFYW